MYATIGEWLIAEKRKKKWNNRQLSEASGVPISTIVSLEASPTPNPRFDTLRNLELALGSSYLTNRGDLTNSELELLQLWERLEDESKVWFMRQIQNDVAVTALKNSGIK